MPHAGLIDEQSLGLERGLLMRARLHIRGGKRRLRQAKIADGIAALYDAVVSAMRWYVVTNPSLELKVLPGEDLQNDADLYRELVRSGVLDGAFDFDDFDRLLDASLEGKTPDIDQQALLNGIESVMIRLGILPFDEQKLPPEDPSTF